MADEPVVERRDERRRGKWWVRSPQQWFNIVLAIVTVANELAEYFKHSDTVMPPWFMEAVATTALVGNIVLRAIPHDNERLTLRNPEKPPEDGGDGSAG